MKKCFSLLPMMLVSILQAYSQPKVTVYTSDFNGMHTELGIGKYDHMTLLRAGVSVVRSVKVPAGLQVTIFEQDNFEGTSLVLLQDASQKLIDAKGFGKVIQNTSLIVEKASEAVMNEPMITVYKDNFSGASLRLRAGYYDHYELGLVDNDQLSSVKVPKGMKVTLYEHGGYSGRSLVLTQDATADFLIRNKFNDITSSIYIEVIPEPKEMPEEEPVDPKPVVVVPVVVVVAEEKDDPSVLKAIIFEDEYKGASRKLSEGRYNTAEMGIGDNTLSSVQVPKGLKVTLYEQPNFKGKSLEVSEENMSAWHLDDLNNAVSSIVVERISRVTVYRDNFSGESQSFDPGYYNTGDFEFGTDELSSVKVMPGLWVLLFEHADFQGRSILLTKDASQDFITGKEFDDLTSSMIVSTTATPLPVVTLYDGDREEPFKTLTPGTYPLLEVGNNMLSSIEIPRGIKVKLFENAEFGGRQMEITKSAGTDFMKQYAFDNITSSVIIESMDPRDLVVTVYMDRYSGFAQTLTPGKYYARDLIMGAKNISSVKVPRGMHVQLFANDNLTGHTDFIISDTDYSDSKEFNDFFSSLIVKDIHQPIVSPLPVTTDSPAPVEEPVVVEEATVEQTIEESPRSTYSYDPPCELSPDDFKSALQSVNSKPFSEDKMQMARLVTKDKCLTLDQIRAFAKDFGFEDQSLEFVKYAYNLCPQKATYYQLEDVFKFMSTQAEFRKFLTEK